MPVRTPTKVSAMAMAKAIAEAMKAAAMCSLRAAATRAGPRRRGDDGGEEFERER